MTDVEETAVKVGRGKWSTAVPAFISLAALIVLTLVITWGWGQPDRLGAAYRWVMDTAVLLRLGPVFLSGIIVWPAMRLRGAAIPWAIAGTIASAIAFGVVGAVQALAFFPPLQAAYYAINPMVVGAIGSQIAWMALGEAYVRWRWHGRTALSPRLLAALVSIAVVGLTLFYVGVIWDGGRHWFYVWIRGYMWLFGTGQ